jgi:hypothetical protein
MLVGKVENRLLSLILSITFGGYHMEFHVQKLAIKNSVPKMNGNYMQREYKVGYIKNLLVESNPGHEVPSHCSRRRRDLSLLFSYYGTLILLLLHTVVLYTRISNYTMENGELKLHELVVGHKFSRTYHICTF